MAFSMVAGARCRMSIKLLGRDDDAAEKGEGGFFVSTFARDALSHAVCKEQDEREGHDHSVSENTDFRLILRRQRDYYFNGDVSETRDYENSRLKNPQVNSQGSWQLPYKATIVWPIRYVLTRSETEVAQGAQFRDQDLYGFLTVDCNARNVFEERYDVQLGAALADSLFAVFDMYRRARQAARTINS